MPPSPPAPRSLTHSGFYLSYNEVPLLQDLLRTRSYNKNERTLQRLWLARVTAVMEKLLK